MRIELSEREHTLLDEVLDQVYRDLKEEIYKTEAHDFKTELKRREALLEGLLLKLRSTEVAPAA